MSGFRIPALALVLLSMTINLLALTGPLFMLQIYDRVLSSRSLPTLMALLVLVIALYAFLAILDAVRSRMTVRIAGLVEQNWSGRVFAAVNRLRLTTTVAGPDPVRDLDTVRQTVAGGGPIALLDLPWMPAYILLIAFLHPILGGVAFAGVVVIGAVAVTSEFALRKPVRDALMATARRQQFNDDARANAEAIRAMGMSGDVGAQWRRHGEELVQTQQALTDRSSGFSGSTKAFRYFLQSAVLATGAWLVIRGEISPGVMIGASLISSRAVAPVEQLVAHWRGLIGARQATGRLRELLKETVETVPEVELPLPHKSLAVTNLVTGPSRRVGPLVAGINFELVAGDGLGIVGESGSGKSSLIRALVGIWPALQGEVRYDDAAIHHYDPERLGKAIGYLPQTVELFSGTIAQNIARFAPDADSEQVIAAAKAAQVHELILQFDDSYDTQVGDLGSRLSAGQRQRIGLARALYGDPFVIVLDEPNSNLDAVGDEALTRSMLAARKRGAITVIVAHRPSAIASVNKLLYLKEGRQGAFGPRDEVLAQITKPQPSSGAPVARPPKTGTSSATARVQQPINVAAQAPAPPSAPPEDAPEPGQRRSGNG